MQTNPNCFHHLITKLFLDNFTKIYRKILPIYWAFLTYMLLKPGTENKEYSFMFPGIDKLIHLLTFFLLGVFFRISFPKISLLFYFVILVFYALLTEFLQHIMALGREAELLDLVADCLGITIAIFIVKFLKLNL